MITLSLTEVVTPGFCLDAWKLNHKFVVYVSHRTNIRSRKQARLTHIFLFNPKYRNPLNLPQFLGYIYDLWQGFFKVMCVCSWHRLLGYSVFPRRWKVRWAWPPGWSWWPFLMGDSCVRISWKGKRMRSTPDLKDRLVKKSSLKKKVKKILNSNSCQTSSKCL